MTVGCDFSRDVFPGWHPLVVHFPLALILTAAAMFCVARLWPNERVSQNLATAATLNLGLGAVALLMALATGLAAAGAVHVDAAAHAAITAHVKAAVVTALLIVLVSVWRGAGAAANSRPSWMFMLMLGAASAALTVTGYRGGQNVYAHSIGVQAGHCGGPNAACQPTADCVR